MKIVHLIMRFIVLLLMISATICFLGAFKFLVLSEPTVSVSMTNVGFAMFIGLSSVLFNWARSLNPDEYSNEIASINQKAMYSILGSVLFILSSGLKYFSVDGDDGKTPHNWVDTILYDASFFLMLFALMFACYVIIGIIINFYYIQEKQKITSSNTPKS